MAISGHEGKVDYIFPHLIDGSGTSPPSMDLGVKARPYHSPYHYQQPCSSVMYATGPHVRSREFITIRHKGYN